VFQLLDLHVIEQKRVGSELQVEAIEHHKACSNSPCKLLPVNPRPALHLALAIALASARVQRRSKQTRNLITV
jgi:hypothetical protein